jgi:transcriptional regulator with XRE-family HTH domain
LVEARKDQGLTQVELARRLHRPQSFVSKYEHAERRLDVVEFLEIVRAMGLDPCAFLRTLEAMGPFRIAAAAGIGTKKKPPTR